MATNIRTTGDLRIFLANMIVGVKNGEVKIQEASAMVKLAAQINESFYSEIKIARVRAESGGAVAEMGQLALTGAAEAKK